ncbi:MAG: ATP-dependent RNA helicase HrpA [Conchiformibius sp.]|nr:ATP-dependent RNA helicase HrpA [Conchiformibius sp.]
MHQPDLSQVLAKDRYFLQRAFRQPEKYGGLNKVREKYAKSQQIYQKRLQNLPKPQFDDSLPVHEKRTEIREAIAAHQVTIICGETGSGKTTQLPKICLELGRGAAGLIGHTQPRRLAARSVAERIAEELGQSIGQAVGYKVRFTDHTARDASIKLMTDGILLAETQTDHFLTAYDTIIIDEAHERSLNIDFLLGYLKQILPQRPDLKLIITSATIDAERFSQHFNGAPVIEVSGRTYPVDVLYRPLQADDEDEAEIETADAIVDAADELARFGAGDILVFLPGEREIRETAEALRKSPLRKNDDILPLFARLSAQEQHKIFHPQGDTRRIILATNVAETSLTVPRIRYVIDTGLARVKRYSARAKVEQLHVEKISQAAARQRSGRCGRVSAGVCIRLYSQEDFEQRPPFTDPEIIRSNLAAVILRMAALKLGNVAAFPFLEAPDQRYINDGFQVLQELGAVNDKNQLSKTGEQMSRLPIDPKISRMLLAAQKHDCVAEMLVIVSALSIQDPRERPLEAREAANKAHERFADKQSDFLSYLNIWDSFQRERDKGLTNKQLVQWCHQYFLSHLRMREWRELHKQLADIAVEMGLVEKERAFRQPEKVAQLQASETAQDQDLSAKLKQKQLDKKQHRAQIRAKKAAGYEQIHRALLTGLIANVGMFQLTQADLRSENTNTNAKRTQNYYTGARGSHFYLFPTSSLFKAKPKWVMAAELTETTKLYARDVAEIKPEWIEAEAPHLVRYHYFEPHWEQKRGEVVASERVTLYGLTVLPRRPIAYGKVAPEEAREIFIRSALVAQECDLKAAFFIHNKKLIREISELEHKSRKQDVLVDEEALFAFYHDRLPENYQVSENKTVALADIRTFEAWLKTVDEKQLFLSREDLMQHAAAHITEEQFPKFWRNQDGKFKLNYRFEPHHPLDGVTLTVPLTVLNRINAAELEWLVPGMIREKLQLLIKALPKQIRRVCVPVPDFITRFLAAEPDHSQPILPQLAHAVAKHAGDMRLLEQINLDDWAAQRLPEHCYANIRVVDDGGQELATGRDLAQLQQQLGNAAAMTFRDNTQEFERDNLTDWNIGTLPESIKFARGKQQLTGYLALQKEKNGNIALRLFDTPEAAAHTHRTGVIALMQLQLKDHMKDLNKGIQGFTQAAMLLKHIPADTLHDDLTQAVCDRAFIGEDELPRSEKAFKEQIKRARSRLPAVKEALSRYLQETAAAYTELNGKLGKHPLTPLLRRRVEHLLSAGFAMRTPWAQWQRLPVYLKAMTLRMEKYSANPARDQAREADINQLEQMLNDKLQSLTRQNQPVPDELVAFAWQLEELRVSLFAQELKTPYSVSVKRLLKNEIFN